MGGEEVFLREIREGCGLSMGDVAAEMGVVEHTISRWETGARMPDINALKRLSEIYNCSIDELVNGPANPLPSRKVARRKSPRGSGRKRAEAQLAL